jgi:hypothetical protein
MDCSVRKKQEARIEVAEMKFLMGCSWLHKERPYKKC